MLFQYVSTGTFQKDKGPEWKFLDDPSTLNNGKPIGYRDTSLDVLDEATHNLWAFFYLRLMDGQIAMDSIQGLYRVTM